MTPTATKTRKQDTNPVLAVEAVTPPPKQGRTGKPAFPEGTVRELAEFIKDGSWGGDGQQYETRQQANTRITRLKRALIHFGHYAEASEIKSRVWETEDGKFRLALTDAAAAK